MRRLWVLLVLCAVLWSSAGPASADELNDLCGNDPDCTVDPSNDFGLGIPGWFVAVFVIVVLIGVAATIYRITAVRTMARNAGLDPGDATRVALLDEDGVSATYLAAQLRGRSAAERTGAGAEPPRSSAERLKELQDLRDQGLISEAEYADRRTAIIGTV